MQTSKQLGFRANLKLAPTALVVIQLCKQLSPSSDEYILYTDNFFTSTKLFKAFRTLGIDACDIAKSGSEYPPSLLAVRDAITKKNNWGLKAHTVIDEVLCMTWIDFNTVQLMTTAYDISDIKILYFLPPRRRHEIPEESVIFRSSLYLSSIAAHSRLISEKDLFVFYSIRCYNQHMRGSNENAQQRVCYFFDRRSSRYWWSLFIFLHDVACLNAFIIYKIYNNDEENFKHLSRENFIRNIAEELINEKADNQRRIILMNDINISSMNRQKSEHHWMRLKKRQYCNACRSEKSTSYKRKREPLAEVNENEKKRRKRGAQTIWGCAAWICQRKAACKISRCWNHMHSRINMKDEMDEMNDEDRMDMRREDMNK